MRDHPLDGWFKRHLLALRVALGVSATLLAVGFIAGLAVLEALGGAATCITGTLVMLYLPRSRL
ncbi:hypothetical protein OJ998_02195 [Solirubrobacter taibaiensis]|nr:hypothetical protein [Solirubrobacter taibaiensis]